MTLRRRTYTTPAEEKVILTHAIVVKLGHLPEQNPEKRSALEELFRTEWEGMSLDQKQHLAALNIMREAYKYLVIHQIWRPRRKRQDEPLGPNYFLIRRNRRRWLGDICIGSDALKHIALHAAKISDEFLQELHSLDSDTREKHRQAKLDESFDHHADRVVRCIANIIVWLEVARPIFHGSYGDPHDFADMIDGRRRQRTNMIAAARKRLEGAMSDEERSHFALFVAELEADRDDGDGAWASIIDTSLLGRRGGAKRNPKGAARGWLVLNLHKLLPKFQDSRYAVICELLQLADVDGLTPQLVRVIVEQHKRTRGK